jgi:small basic protein (TIGR04137 family)
MSIDRSLRTSNSLAGHRNVLTRAERIAKLTQQGRFDPAAGSTPTGLPKVASRKASIGKKAKKGPEKEGEE